VVEDTETDPAKALDKLRGLHGQGIRLVVGPYASSEVRGVKDFADQNGIVLMSPLSTARSLAIPDDNVLRFTPDDEQEGIAVAELAWADGMRVILPVSRDDDGNRGLQTAMKPAFEKLGGTVLPAIVYPANEEDFADEARTIDAALQGAIAGEGQIGIYLTAFGEVAKLFDAASRVPALQQVPWYGSDSVALSKDLVEEATAAEFATLAKYPNPILGLRESDRSLWGPVSDRLAQKLGRTPDAFALAAYDALTVGHMVLSSLADNPEAPAIRQAIVQTASNYTGLTGSMALNEAGDRSIGNYDFWSVCKRNNQFTWIRTYSYTAAAGGSGRVDRVESC
jgi:branched-chain amino acid transport system substrate-binding protein